MKLTHYEIKEFIFQMYWLKEKLASWTKCDYSRKVADLTLTPIFLVILMNIERNEWRKSNKFDNFTRINLINPIKLK